jgi:hypothetical protein
MLYGASETIPAPSSVGVSNQAFGTLGVENFFTWMSALSGEAQLEGRIRLHPEFPTQSCSRSNAS